MLIRIPSSASRATVSSGSETSVSGRVWPDEQAMVSPGRVIAVNVSRPSPVSFTIPCTLTREPVSTPPGNSID